MISKGFKFAGIGAIACLLGYFLPWITAGAFGINISVNGWQETFGMTVAGVGVGSGNFLVILVLLAPIAVGYLAFRSFSNGAALDKMLDAYGLIGIGVVVLLVLLSTSGTANSLGVSLGFGWILCLLSAIAIGVGGFFNYQQIAKPV